LTLKRMSLYRAADANPEAAVRRTPSFRSGPRHQNEFFPDLNYVLEQQPVFAATGPGQYARDASANAVVRRQRRTRLVNRLIEQSMRLKGRLMDLRQTRGLKTVVFSGANHNVGVWSVLMNLAKTFEKTETLKILVVDANVKSPGISNHLGTRGFGKGLLDLLEEPESRDGVLQKIHGAPIYFMSHGRKRRQPENLLQPERMRQVLQRMEKLFDFIIIDAPPLSDFADGYVWSRAADGLVLVCHPERTTMPDVRAIQAAARQQNIEILGHVLNRRNYAVPRFVYEWF